MEQILAFSAPMQVDWITGICEAQAWRRARCPVYDTGRVIRLGPGGEVELMHSKGVLLEGSFENRLLVQSRTGSDLWISGNPVKWIQGHNLYGPSDPIELFFTAGGRVREIAGLFPSAATWEANDFLGPRFTRIDLTRSYRFVSAAAARSWLRDVAASARSRRAGALYNNGTVTFGAGSTYWQMVCYHKGDELQARGRSHGLPAELAHRERLEEWSQGVVRFEVRLRARELERLHLREEGPKSRPVELMPERWQPLELWSQYFGKVQWNQNARMVESDMIEAELSRALRTTLTVWRAGKDPRTLMARNTFWRHRKALLDACGVDIASPPPEQAQPDAGDQVGAELDPAGWDPQPLEGYSWEQEKQRKLV